MVSVVNRLATRMTQQSLTSHYDAAAVAADDDEIEQRTDDVSTLETRGALFSSFFIRPELLRSLKALRILHPSPIQLRALPLGLAGHSTVFLVQGSCFWWHSIFCFSWYCRLAPSSQIRDWEDSSFRYTCSGGNWKEPGYCNRETRRRKCLRF